MPSLRPITELLARKTGRRDLLGRSAQLATGTLLGVAAGVGLRANPLSAGIGTACTFPGPPCPCEGCSTTTGACQKPCIFVTDFYASGCWVMPGNISCCDCDCPPLGGFQCGCGTDYHTANCPA
jgi:hypothetical protein